MGIKKSIAAAVLAASMVLGSFNAIAATSPDTGKTTTATSYVDRNTRDHANDMVTSTINAKETTATVTGAKSTSTKKGYATIVVKQARTKSGKAIPITAFGNGKKGVLNSKNGKKITTVKFTSKKKVTVKANAFKNSKVKKVAINAKVAFQKDAFKSTGVKNPTIRIYVKKSSSITAASGAFSGLNKKAKIIVSKKKMSNAEFKKLKAKLVKAGFKGTIVRK